MSFNSRASIIKDIDKYLDDWIDQQNITDKGVWAKLELRLAYALEDGDVTVMDNLIRQGVKVNDIFLLVCGILNGHKDSLVPWIEEHLLDKNYIDDSDTICKSTNEFYKLLAEQSACQLNVVGLDSALEQGVKPTLEELEFGITENDPDLTTRADVTPVRSWIERNMPDIWPELEKRIITQGCAHLL